MKVEEGDGWRLVFDPERRPFPLLIGGERWAAELSGPEAHALQRVLGELAEQHRRLTDTLMAEESIGLEMEVEVLCCGEPEGAPDPSPCPAGIGAAHPSAARPPGEKDGGGVLWAELEGNRERWSIRFILTPAGGGGRAFEAGWSERSSGAFLTAFLQLDGLGVPGDEKAPGG